MSEDANSRLIYSTSGGELCPDCSMAKNECRCRIIKDNLLPDHLLKLKIRHETAGRKNKGVTIISGLPLSRLQLEILAKRLKSTFGTGGAVKDFTIELQGDMRKKSEDELRKLGFTK
jgi:translation initiation factor 1